MNTCANCKYFLDLVHRQECRRFPPTGIIIDNNATAGRWNAVGEQQWCGEWAPKSVESTSKTKSSKK